MWLFAMALRLNETTDLRSFGVGTSPPSASANWGGETVSTWSRRCAGPAFVSLPFPVRRTRCWGSAGEDAGPALARFPVFFFLASPHSHF